MIKNFIFISAFILFIFSSCSSEEEKTNVPPSAVTGIEVEVIENTFVKLFWNASEDPNGDEVSYNVVVNGNVVANRTTENSLEIDVTPYLSGSRNSTRGMGLELTVNITAFDSENNVSEESVVVRYVYVNRDPGEFDFKEITFDFYSYSSVTVEWLQAADADDDLLSYDVYINEELVVDDYVIGTNQYTNWGSAHIPFQFRELLDQDITIKVIANDRSGGLKEISRTYNFRATDVDLGEIALPYAEINNYEFLEDEIDNKIGYSFTLTERTGISLTDFTGNMQYTLTDSNNNYLSGGYNALKNEALNPGSYYIEVSKNYNSLSNGSFNLIFRDANETNTDLGNLAFPYSESFDITSINEEPDNNIIYTFTAPSGNYRYTFSSVSGVSYELRDSNQNIVSNSNYYNHHVLSLVMNNPGTYYLKVINNSSYNEITGSFNINIEETNEITDNMVLGSITTPYTRTFDYDTTVSVNGRTRINFTIATSSDYHFETTSANYDTYLYLYRSNGQLIRSDDDGGGPGNLSKMTGSLSAGSYYVEVGGFGNSTGNGVLLFNLQ